MKKKIVVMGGGNGSAITIEALRACAIDMDLSAVVAASDSGGSSGVLREEFDTLPAGDILRAVLAMSVYDYRTVLKPLFYRTRFTDVGKLSGHNLGNLFLVLAGNYDGKFVSAICALEQAVGAVGHVYPVTKHLTHLVATLESGTIIRTESEIDRPTHDLADRISSLTLDPVVEANDHVLDLLREADYIFLGPGSLYCSVIATLLPNGIREAIAESKAKLVYVVGNAYERRGEAGPSKLKDFVSQLENYLPRKLDMVIHNDAVLTDEQKDRYTEKDWLTIDGSDEPEGVRVVHESFESQSGGLCHEGLAEIIKKEIF